PGRAFTAGTGKIVRIFHRTGCCPIPNLLGYRAIPSAVLIGRKNRLPGRRTRTASEFIAHDRALPRPLRAERVLARSPGTRPAFSGGRAYLVSAVPRPGSRCLPHPTRTGGRICIASGIALVERRPCRRPDLHTPSGVADDRGRRHAARVPRCRPGYARGERSGSA